FAWLVEDEPELAYELAADLVAMHAPTADPWVEELAATTALATGRWAEVPELAPVRAVEPWLEWLGAVRYAESLERSGLDDAAIDAWIALEQRLDRAVRQVGVAAEQERFLAGRSISAQRLVDLLLRGGHDDAAMCRARLAIARAVQAADRNARVAALTPAQRAGWDAEIERYQALRSANEQATQGEWVLPAEELARVRMRRAEQLADADARIDALLGISPAAADCARLAEPSATHPLVVAFAGVDDVVVFVADDARVHTLRVPLDATPARYAQALVEPLGALADAERVTVLASGVATAIPFHALVHEGATLLPDTPIAYGLDLLSRPAAIDDDEPSAALIVADPRGDLGAAAEEAAIVEQRLRDASWRIVVRRGDEATREALLAGLAEASLFHYAGHGSRGVAAWDAALRLAGDTELRVGDVLAIPKVPAHVVLAGCHTGRRDDASLAGGMSLGRAFVLAGADAALVADTEVEDSATRALTEALYRDPSLALPTALRRAQTQLRAGGIADWSSFRVLVR
ncbi:MAG TPA: CHAT domain-containing protein, partial [Nannocystaceae bacterium]|nr:CHAT domain-containing protein [Nannocystaceae bacterium]